MAIARPWRAPRPDGPYAATPDDHAALNHVFSEAFTERYRRDGLVGVRVPFLNPAIWRYAIEDANGGALVWRDERHEIAAFNIVHCSGREGWMGPLAVRPDAQGSGLGKEIVRSGIDWLMSSNALTIGLETMPRTMDNIGFYSSLGFSPGRLTVTVTIDAAPGGETPSLFGRLSARDKNDVLMESSELSESVLPACDFAREIELTDALGLGETILFREDDRITGFALVHTVPLVEGRARDETRVLKLVLSERASLASAVATLADFAKRGGTRRVAFRVQTEYLESYQQLIAMGGRVRWTDLRMALSKYPEGKAKDGLLWSNWEI
ncbi:MAG TPA: GNAT family N-acetyltransferase [Gemmatimonadaceae bacterium]|nr:GNAT family N-acetyltransferase [Gemmatimonadaceae bacterium]